jgi:co-chaperonin GroES (HSP10)
MAGNGVSFAEAIVTAPDGTTYGTMDDGVQVTTKGGALRIRTQEGKVLAVGPGRIDDNGNRVPLDVAVGDVVIYSKYGGTEVKYNGEEYLILSARDVLAVIG